jgi:glycosyltransferase involved in cell wall biosynthesis
MDSANNKVVYCLPVYNGELHLERCLDSILGQTHNNVHVLIGDNCSTDKTGDICRQYAIDHKNITYLKRSKNQGSYWNYLNLMSHLKYLDADFFVLAQDDCVYDPNHSQKCINVLNSNNKQVSSLTFLVKENNGARQNLYQNFQTRGMGLVDRVRIGSIGDSVGGFFTGVHRVDAFENNRDVWINQTTNRLTDLEFLIHALVAGEVNTIPEPLVMRSYPNQVVNEDYNSYLERRHVANNFRQGLTMPFCNGLSKICQQLFQRTDINEKDNVSKAIDILSQSIEKRYSLDIYKEIQRAIRLVTMDKVDQPWFSNTNDVGIDNQVKDNQKDKLVFLNLLLGDALKYYSFTSNPNMKDLIDICYSKIEEYNK